MIEISEELKTIAQAFKNHNISLYIVGGYVRDSLMKIKNRLKQDIDLCSVATPKQVEEIVKEIGMSYRDIGKNIGLTEIVGERVYEHSTFRRVVYDQVGNVPTAVEFTSSIREDAENRDFKINAIYYDIINNKYIDPFGGVKDLKANVIKTIKTPRVVFGEDPEKVLRLIRFSVTLGLNIGEDEMKYAKENAYKIQGLSKKRVRNEFNKLLLADKMYENTKDSSEAHIKVLDMLKEFEIMPFLFPALDEIYNQREMTDTSKSFFEKIMKHLKRVRPSLRIPVIFLDILKQEKSKEQQNFDEESFVKELVEKNLGSEGLNYPKEVLSKVKNIVLGYGFERKKFAMGNKDIRSYVFYHSNAIDEILELKRLYPLKANETEKEKAKRLELIETISQTFKQMKSEKVIFDKEKLNISGIDIINNFPKIKLDRLDDFKLDIAAKLAENPVENTKENLIKIANKVMISKQDIYFEK